jgi:hypothetical protein
MLHRGFSFLGILAGIVLSLALSIPGQSRTADQYPKPENWNLMSAEDQATWLRLAPKTWAQMSDAERRDWYRILENNQSRNRRAAASCGRRAGALHPCRAGTWPLS